MPLHPSTKIVSINSECSSLSTGEGGMPKHVAIILDVNSRWAAARGLPRIAGHREGAKAVKRCLEAAVKRNIQWLTLYAFSSENWRRTPEEVFALTDLLRYYLQHEVKALHNQDIRIQFIGDLSRFDQKLQKSLSDAEYLTRNNRKLTLTLALSYGGRDDILQAAKRLVTAIQENEIKLENVTETMFSKYLQTVNMPDPDLVLRTSGECRLSNFLLWQSAYAELVFLETLWPDFDEQHFSKAIDIYTRRERRFGARPG